MKRRQGKFCSDKTRRIIYYRPSFKKKELRVVTIYFDGEFIRQVNRHKIQIHRRNGSTEVFDMKRNITFVKEKAA